MKPEIGYDHIVIGSYIDDLLKDVEWNLKRTGLRDPYFKQLSVEKFALETLLQEIFEYNGIVTPIEVLERFAQETERCIVDSHDPNSSYTFEVSRDTAISILDGLYFGYLEGEKCGGFEKP